MSSIFGEDIDEKEEEEMQEKQNELTRIESGIDKRFNFLLENKSRKPTLDDI